MWVKFTAKDDSPKGTTFEGDFQIEPIQTESGDIKMLATGRSVSSQTSYTAELTFEIEEIAGLFRRAVRNSSAPVEFKRICDAVADVLIGK
jgi:ABC-type hemin transport system ATPase subunit